MFININISLNQETHESLNIQTFWRSLTVFKVNSLLQKKTSPNFITLINIQLSHRISNWCYGKKTLPERLQQLCHEFVKFVYNLNSKSTVCNTSTIKEYFNRR